jgi:signal peptidase I
MSRLGHQAAEARDGEAMVSIGPDGLTPSQRRADRLARKLLVPLLVFLIATVLVFYVFFDFARVEGASMAPTLEDREYVLITKRAPAPRRGEVVVFRVTDRGVGSEWIKRVVAIGGDRVRFRGSFVWVNDAPEPFVHPILDDKSVTPAGELTVPEGHVFCLGDNRPVSLDSRFVGPLDLDQVHGKVVAVYAPITRIRLVPGP